MEFTEALEPTDFLDPRCPFCADAYGKERPVHPIDTDRVTAKLDEYLSKNDYAAAERHLAYWLAEAEEGRAVCLDPSASDMIRYWTYCRYETNPAPGILISQEPPS